MRICVYGAGAGGGHLAVKLALAGHEVSVVARGAQLAAIRDHGLRLRAGETLHHVAVSADEDPARFGGQDLVIVAVKATSLAGIAERLSALVADRTHVLFPQNGITWWYPVGLPPDRPRPPDIPIFRLADRFLAAMRPAQVLAGTVYSANEVEAPGVIRNNTPEYNRVDIAAIDGHEGDALASLRAALERAGIVSIKPDDIRAAVWSKLLMNASGSVVALLTGGRSADCRDDPGLREIFLRAVRELMGISAAHGYPLDAKMDPERLLERLPRHPPSLLQDYERRRPMELGEVLLAPLAFARARQIETPTLDVLAAIAAKRAMDRDLISRASVDAYDLWRAE
jgi:2-dehydropantoate 2-reductase